MKLSFALIALCVAQTAAFSVQGPSMPSSSALKVGSNSEGNQADVNLQKIGTSTGSIFDSMTPVIVQGGSLRTWSFSSMAIKRVKVSMKTEGRPMNANVDLWQGPDNAPQKMSVYIEDGSIRPFSAVIETPRGQNAIALRNTGEMEFPLSACVEGVTEDAQGNESVGAVIRTLADSFDPEVVQGGAIKTYSFDPFVASVQILLQTDGRPLNARVELLQGPNNNKQVVELYTEDGLDRPFFAVIETPGVGNVVRILNTAPVEFPMTARVQPYMVDPGSDEPGGGWDSQSLYGGR